MNCQLVTAKCGPLLYLKIKGSPLIMLWDDVLPLHWADIFQLIFNIKMIQISFIKEIKWWGHWRSYVISVFFDTVTPTTQTTTATLQQKAPKKHWGHIWDLIPFSDGLGHVCLAVWIQMHSGPHWRIVYSAGSLKFHNAPKICSPFQTMPWFASRHQCSWLTSTQTPMAWFW